MESFDNDISLEGAHLARFHDRSAPGGQSRRNLRADEAGVAVPRRDEASYADRSHEDVRGTRFLYKIVGFENPRGIGERLRRVAGGGLGAPYRGAILFHGRLHDVLLSAFDFRMQPPEHVDTFGLR